MIWYYYYSQPRLAMAYVLYAAKLYLATKRIHQVHHFFSWIEIQGENGHLCAVKSSLLAPQLLYIYVKVFSRWHMKKKSEPTYLLIFWILPQQSNYQITNFCLFQELSINFSAMSKNFSSFWKTSKLKNEPARKIILMGSQ